MVVFFYGLPQKQMRLNAENTAPFFGFGKIGIQLEDSVCCCLPQRIFVAELGYAAQQFLNFLCRDDIAMMNFEYIYF